MDGFVGTPISPGSWLTSGPVVMGYWTRDDLPFIYSLASTFSIAGRCFSSLLGQTFPNRRYLIAGTSAGMTDNGDLTALTAVVPPAANANDLTDFLDFGALAIRWPTFPGCRGWPRPVTPPRRWPAR